MCRNTAGAPPKPWASGPSSWRRCSPRGAEFGAIFVGRETIGSFSNQEIALLKTFAAQAVIAIENTRLLNELRELLQQQTATADVLKVISSSPGELEPVFQAMLENATRICEAKFGVLYRYDDDLFHLAAMLNAPKAYAEFQQQRGPFQADPGSPLRRLLQTKQVYHSADEAAEANPGLSARLADARSTVCVPMLKENELVGAIVIYRQEVRAFTDKQIDLVANFAAQAVIAIENTRLLNELRESPPAANRHSRRAQGYQPVDIRFAGGPRHVSRVGGPSM